MTRTYNNGIIYCHFDDTEEKLAKWYAFKKAPTFKNYAGSSVYRKFTESGWFVTIDVRGLKNV